MTFFVISLTDCFWSGSPVKLLLVEILLLGSTLRRSAKYTAFILPVWGLYFKGFFNEAWRSNLAGVFLELLVGSIVTDGDLKRWMYIVQGYLDFTVKYTRQYRSNRLLCNFLPDI